MASMVSFFIHVGILSNMMFVILLLNFSLEKRSLYFTHTCLALIPKIESPSNFSELRPISLSNFSNKIVSKILARRLNPILHRLISVNQSGFVLGRLITENFVLAQEIIHDMSKHNIGDNIVIKLDMAKAYDRMAWNFLMDVLRRFGFSYKWINLVWNLISSVWYSILINGSRNGFFSSAQGLKQGDPLSPSLFILGAEVLSRTLNSLLTHDNFIPFSMHQRGPQIKYLAYADDIVIFSSSKSKSVNLIMKQIKNYEKASGQEVNKNKSFFLTNPKASAYRINKMRQCTGFLEKNFPFTY